VSSHAPSPPDPLPSTPAVRLGRFARQFLHLESATGLVLLGCTAAALALANSPWGDAVQTFWSLPLTITIGAIHLEYPLWYWVNDGLMALFFFVIGLEIKREIVTGELSDRRAVVLPLFAALGGAAVPALVFLAVNGTGEGARAWAVPMATDIAFVVGCLALLGSRVPPPLKIFMLSLAIFDDLLAVVIIAVFYSGAIGLGWLAAAVGSLAAMGLLLRLGVRSISVYAVLGVVVWFFTLESGVHPTIAGVALGLLAPARPWLSWDHLRDSAVAVRQQIDEGTREGRREALAMLEVAARENIAPTERLEAALHPWVAFGVMPVFALANAGVAIEPAMLGSTLSLAIAVGLLGGKFVGITSGAWLAVRLGWGVLPSGVGWRAMAAAACLAGIGFTMSMFIASLALDGTTLEAAKSGILLGSLVSGVVGFLALRALLPARAPERR
jgi:NhaA family Na+:H+ antiporter